MGTPLGKLSMTKGILIDPKAKTITEVESTTGFELHEIYALLGCSCITSFAMRGDDTALCDDEGLLKGEEHMQNVGCYTFKGGNQSHLVGRTLVVGTGMEGETISPDSTLADIHEMIQWVDTAPTTEQMDELLDIKVTGWDV
jgi:hypothetical protein